MNAEDRTREGTKQDRDREHVPLGVRVRYGLAILVALIAAFAATQAWSVSGTANRAADEASHAAISAKDAVAQVAKVAHAAEALAAESTAIAKQSAAAAAAAAAATAAIQAQRVAACKDGNARHHATIRVLDQLLHRADVHASPAMRRQIAQSKASTLLLISALAPLRDCATFVAK